MNGGNISHTDLRISIWKRQPYTYPFWFFKSFPKLTLKLYRSIRTDFRGGRGHPMPPPHTQKVVKNYAHRNRVKWYPIKKARDNKDADNKSLICKTTTNFNYPNNSWNFICKTKEKLTWRLWTRKIRRRNKIFALFPTLKKLSIFLLPSFWKYPKDSLW